MKSQTGKTYSKLYSALDIAKWFIARNNCECREYDCKTISFSQLKYLLCYVQKVSFSSYGIPIFNKKTVLTKNDYKSINFTNIGKNDCDLLNGIENDVLAHKVLEFAYENR